MSEPAKDEAMSNWPDPDKPGVPLNPEVDGFHWLGNAAFVWASRFGNWALNGAGFPPEFFATTAYLGPCLTPAEADALHAENARLREALEDLLDDSEVHDFGEWFEDRLKQARAALEWKP
jgi:hypothetical protein